MDPPIVVICLSVIFGAIFIVGPFLVKRGENRGITRCCIMLTAFCMWLFWVTVYIAQIHPLLGPRLKNTTMAWIAHKIGKPAKGDNIESNVEGNVENKEEEAET